MMGEVVILSQLNYLDSARILSAILIEWEELSKVSVRDLYCVYTIHVIIFFAQKELISAPLYSQFCKRPGRLLG